jgi:hypothetical protein
VRLTSTPDADGERPARAGFLLPWETLTAPGRAFRRIAETHEWLPAYAVIALAGLAAAALTAPALLHLASVTPPPPGATAPKTVAEIADANRALVATLAIEQTAIPLIAILLTASALTVVARLRASTLPYFAFVALAANCMVPSALGSLVSATGIRLHDPSSFNDIRSVLVAVPTNLAVFAAPGNEREIGFLGRFDLFDVWSYVLLGYGFAALVPVRLTTALALAFGIDFLLAILL